MRYEPMFGIGFTEIILILIVGLIVIGPDKLPELAKTIGKAFNEFKRTTNDIKRTIEGEPVRPTYKSSVGDPVQDDQSAQSPPEAAPEIDEKKDAEVTKEKPEKKAPIKKTVKPRKTRKKTPSKSSTKKSPKSSKGGEEH